MLYPAGDHSKPTIRLYDAQGLVRQLTISASTPDGYYYFAPLTTTDGHAYFPLRLCRPQRQNPL